VGTPLIARNPISSRFPPPENKNLTDPAEIERAIKLGEYVKNGSHSYLSCTHYCLSFVELETLALYSLRKYRHLRRMYPPGSSMSDPP
jgi:hypothetical protein